MKITQNLTEYKLNILTGTFKEGGKEIYRKSICIIFFKYMIMFNLWKIKYE